jgi:hypothetical protein
VVGGAVKAGFPPHIGTVFALQHVAMTIRACLFSLVAAAVFAGAAIHPAAADDIVKMEFEGFGPAGLHVLTTHTVIQEAPTGYQIEGDFATAGIGAWFVSVANRSMARGRVVANTPKPEIFDSETERNGALQHLRVDYGPNGMPNGSATPAPSEPVTPINYGSLAGTVDNLTAYLLLERQLARGGGCNLRVPVFDGRHRYDLEFSDAGNAVLSPADGQNFSGPARACRMTRDKIGGFYTNKSHEEGASAGTIWYAQLMSGDLAVPVRLVMQTEIGDISLYLSKLQGRGVNLRLME